MLWHHMIFYFLALLQMQHRYPLLVVTSRTLHIPATILIIFLMITAHISSCYIFTRWTLYLLFYFLVSYIFVSRSYFLEFICISCLKIPLKLVWQIFTYYLGFFDNASQSFPCRIRQAGRCIIIPISHTIFVLHYEFCYLFICFMGILLQNMAYNQQFFGFHTMGLLCDWKFTHPRIILETTYAVMECSQ